MDGNIYDAIRPFFMPLFRDASDLVSEHKHIVLLIANIKILLVAKFTDKPWLTVTEPLKKCIITIMQGPG